MRYFASMDAAAPPRPRPRRSSILRLAGLAAVSLGWLTLPTTPAASPDPTTPAASPAPIPTPTAEARTPAWVFFRDKGPLERGPARAAALLTREAELPARALARRTRARGDRGVDTRDLPLDPSYVARVEATGAAVRVQSRWLNAVSVETTAAQRIALAALPEVARVEPVRQRTRIADPALAVTPAIEHGADPLFGISTAQLALIGADVLQRDCGLTGAGVVVGVQDSGFDLEHQAFAGLNVLAAHDFINDDDTVANELGDPVNQANHGTLVMGTLAGSDPGVFMGVAPGISVILSKTERVDTEIPAEEDYYVAGLEWIESQGADIFTASLGYADWYGPDDFDGQTAVTTIAVNVAFDNGLAVFASMGNSGPGPSTLIAPADAPGALAVGATTLAGDVTNFSSRGPTSDGRTKPDIAAPGAQVASVDVGSVDQYTNWNGTSAAAPVAAGLAALVLEAQPGLTAQELADLLRDTASQAATPDDALGWGIIDGRLASGAACGCNDTDGDGYIGTLCGGDDCDDANPDTHPDAEELCDGLDNNCNGTLHGAELDEDGDGVLACAGDCDDTEPMVAPGLEEICGDGLDNDCDQGDQPCPSDDDGPATSNSGASGGGVDDTGPLPGDGPLPGGTADDTSATDDGAGASDGGGDGCGCSAASSEHPLAGLLLLGLLGLGRRRRRPS